MRCIEIGIQNQSSSRRIRLIETWDVLKCAEIPVECDVPIGLIETWDVLK